MKTLLEISRLRGGYHKTEVVKGVSLAINYGDFMGIIGPNGSGKTTLFRLITRVIGSSSGTILLAGKETSSMDLKDFCRKVAFVGQETDVDFSFTVMETCLMGRIPHLKRLQFETRQDLRIAEEALALTDTLGLKNKRIDELSAGERQRVIIARALTQEPELMLLDEPTSHLDIGHQIQIMDLLKKLSRSKKLTISMVLHDLNLASAYCNRIVLLDRGAVYKEGVAEEVLTYQNIEAVYKTVVLVEKNRLTGKPNVLLVPKEK